MNIREVREELAAALQTVPSLQGRTQPYPEQSITPPAGFPSFIETDFDRTYKRGSDAVGLTVVVLVSTSHLRSAVQALDAYQSGDGDESIKAAIEDYTYTALDSVRVESTRVEEYLIGAVPYLAALFPLDIIGSGTTS